VIALIDYGAGNLRSVHKALLHLGVEVRLVTEPGGLKGCPGIVLPGVGAFDDCSIALRNQALMEATRQRIDEGAWFLGICVGYQILFERSEEFQSTSPGFGLFKGPVVRFPDQPGLKVPQIGWNQVKYTHPDCPIFKGIPDNSYFTSYIATILSRPMNQSSPERHITAGFRLSCLEGPGLCDPVPP
jgi:glutamine amidotransferase